jgi:hypothetical protein
MPSWLPNLAWVVLVGAFAAIWRFACALTSLQARVSFLEEARVATIETELVHLRHRDEERAEALAELRGVRGERHAD